MGAATNLATGSLMNMFNNSLGTANTASTGFDTALDQAQQADITSALQKNAMDTTQELADQTEEQNALKVATNQINTDEVH